jgi:hypothetical protein
MPEAASAWDRIVYEDFAKRLCERFDCGCEKIAVEASIKPDTVFRDQPTHRCYDPGYMESVPDSTHYIKPDVFDCPAMEKAHIWIENAKTRHACGRWESIGFSLHYFLDAKKFWNNVMQANRSCVSEHDEDIRHYFLFGGDSWRSCVCGVCISSKDYESWLLEYSEMIKPLSFAKRNTSPSVTIVANEIDWDAAVELGNYLLENEVKTTLAGPRDFKKHMNSEFLVIAGGHKALDTGEIVDRPLSDAEKNTILTSLVSGALLKKNDVWITGQYVYFIAGFEKNATAKGLMEKKGEILEKANSLAAEVSGPECIRNDDCGIGYFGPYVCTTTTRSARTYYQPICRFGSCKIEAQRPSTRDCAWWEYCVLGYGCADKDSMIEVDGVIRRDFFSHLKSERAVAILGVERHYSIYVRINDSSDDSIICQLYTPRGWEDAELKPAHGFYEIRKSISSDEIGDKVVKNRIRCGEINEDAEFITYYLAEHDFTLTAIPPPLTFTISIKPETINLRDCFDRGNTSLRIENFAGQDITCTYKVGDETSTVDVSRPGASYVVTGGYWTWDVIEETVPYMSYYSGSDFPREPYTEEDEEGNIIVYDVQHDIIEQYLKHPQEETFYEVIIYKKTYRGEIGDPEEEDREWIGNLFGLGNDPQAQELRYLNYEWSYDPWVDNIITVDSDECAVDRVQVRVTCTDEYGQTATLTKDVLLNITDLNRYISII